MDDEIGPEEEAPLDDEEIQALRQDLVDVEILKDVLGPRGIKGTVFFCQDCEEDHYLTWDLLAGNLRELLDKGESPVHEPAFNPDPDEYVSWDYARGFLDGYESFEQEELGALSGRLAAELGRRGYRLDEIKALMSALGLQAPFPDTVPGDGEGR